MPENKNIVIIGGGPSGLMAAEILSKEGYSVSIYDRMPSFGRKFLMAGRGGLNITHSEPLAKFTTRYGNALEWISPYINNFTPDDLRAWCHGLGQETFVGSSGRVFPKVMKAAPLLRAWLQRLSQSGVKYYTNHTWVGWNGDQIIFKNKSNVEILIKADAVLLALGGSSWPRLGSDGSWVKILSAENVDIKPIQPANCGFIVPWSEYFKTRFAGMPLKPVVLKYDDISHQGEVMITAKGIEGGAIYAISSKLREELNKHGEIILYLDLRHNLSVTELSKKLEVPRGKKSFSTYLAKAGFSQLAVNLLREAVPVEQLPNLTAHALAEKFKNLPVKLTATTDISRAISSAGGVSLDAIDKNFMLKNKPGVFVAGEMLDWEAPTGGYLLQGCFSTAIAAANGVMAYLR